VSVFESPWGILAIGFAASAFWRALGAVLAGKIEVDTPLFDWCVCVTQALVGGLMVRAILLPTAGLAQAPLLDRAGASALAIAVFVLGRGRIMPGVICGVAALAALLHLRWL